MGDTSARHQALVDRLKQQGVIRTSRVEAAFRRERFDKACIIVGAEILQLNADGHR